MSHWTAESPALETAFVALGSNVGDRREHLRRALAALAAAPGVRVVAVSPVYEAEAHVLPGSSPQPDFLNAVARLDTTLAPEALMDVLQRVETEAGRDRGVRWAPRPLDLDLLLYGDREVGSAAGDAGLTVPHPRLAARRFVLQPLADLAPERAVPGLDATVADLLARCSDTARLARQAVAL